MNGRKKQVFNYENVREIALMAIIIVAKENSKFRSKNEIKKCELSFI